MISFNQLKAVVGAEQTANFRVLKQQLDESFVDEVAEQQLRPLTFVLPVRYIAPLDRAHTQR